MALFRFLLENVIQPIQEDGGAFASCPKLRARAKFPQPLPSVS
jgi:hypothetical protein